MNENGEYTNIVVKVEDDIPENSCGSLLNNLKVINCQINNSIVKHNEYKDGEIKLQPMTQLKIVIQSGPVENWTAAMVQ